MPGYGHGPPARSSVPVAASSLCACVPPCGGRAPVSDDAPERAVRLLLLAPDADGLLGTASLASVGLGALPAHGQVPPVAEPPVRADLLEALDVERHLAAQVALHLVAPVDDVPEPVDLLLRQVPDTGVRVDVGLGQDLLAGGQADTEDVGEGDLHALLARDIDARDACHAYPCRCLCF